MYIGVAFYGAERVADRVELKLTRGKNVPMFSEPSVKFQVGVLKNRGRSREEPR